MWHPPARWETSRIAAIDPRAARYGRSRPLLTLAPFTALRTRARVKKEYLPTHPWAIGKTPARALRKWRATGVNQFADMANAVWRPSRKGLASRLAALAGGRPPSTLRVNCNTPWENINFASRPAGAAARRGFNPKPQIHGLSCTDYPFLRVRKVH